MDELKLKVAEPIKSGHWYHADGSPQHTIEGANGKERGTILTDARKYNLFPSVTGIDKDVLTNFGVSNWYINTVLEASYTLPTMTGEDFENFCKRIRKDANQFGSEARKFGSEIHDAINNFHGDKNYKPDPALEPWFEEYLAWYQKNIEEVVCSERTVVNRKIGYAGTMDMVAKHVDYPEPILIDIKTQNMKGKKPNYYDSWIRQLAAYRECVDGKPMVMSLVINSKEPMQPFEKLWTDQEVKTGWDVFRRACEIWQLQRNYFPGGEK